MTETRTSPLSGIPSALLATTVAFWPMCASTDGVLRAIALAAPTLTPPPEPMVTLAVAAAPTISAVIDRFRASVRSVASPRNAAVEPSTFALPWTAATPTRPPPPLPVVALANWLDFALITTFPSLVIVVRPTPAVGVPSGPARATTDVFAIAVEPPALTFTAPPPPLVIVAVALVVSSASTVRAPTSRMAPSSTSARTFTGVLSVPMVATGRNVDTLTIPPDPPPAVAVAVETTLARTVVDPVVVTVARPMRASTSPVISARASAVVTLTMPAAPADRAAAAVRVVFVVSSLTWTTSAWPVTVTPSAT